MPLVAIVTLIGVALLVAALAFYLIRVALMLRDVSFNVGTIIAGLRAIAAQAEPLGEYLRDTNQELTASQQALEQLLAQKARQRPKPPPQPGAADPDAALRPELRRPVFQSRPATPPAPQRPQQAGEQERQQMGEAVTLPGGAQRRGPDPAAPRQAPPTQSPKKAVARKSTKKAVAKKAAKKGARGGRGAGADAEAVAQQLEDVSGVGPAKREELLARFGTPQRLRTATVDELEEVPGISRSLAARIHRALRS